MQLFEDAGGTLYPTSEIERVYREDQGPTEVWWVELKNGNTHRLAFGEYPNLRRSGTQFLPAQPGHYVLSVDFDTGRNDPITLIPVIGWLICPVLGPCPVTLDGINNDQNDCVPVLFPDGKVHEPCVAIHESLDAFIAANRKN